jgi:hypothetical protein
VKPVAMTSDINIFPTMDVISSLYEGDDFEVKTFE